MPYVFLLGVLLLSRLWAPLRGTLLGVAVIQFDRDTLPLLYNPGFALVLARGFAWALFGDRVADLRGIVARTGVQWWPAAVATLAFVGMGQAMEAGRLTEELALGVAGWVGREYRLAAPWIGGLGGFLTGSNAGSNAMLLSLQMVAAHQAGLSSAWAAIVQNPAGSHATWISGPRLALASVAVDRPGSEGELTPTAASPNGLILAALTFLTQVAGRLWSL